MGLRIHVLDCPICGYEMNPVFSDLGTGEQIDYCEKCKNTHHQGEYNPVFLELIKNFKKIT